MKTENCPLCKYTNTNHFSKSENRIYLHCSNCDLVFVPTEYFLSQEDEKKKYDKHQNSPDNQGYRDFLNRLMKPLCSHITKGEIGLDFGSGPEPTLSVIMEELGYKMDIYDYFYHNEPKVFENSYDFITTTEVIEHLHKPYDEILKLWRCLKSGGVLGIMTAFRPSEIKFEDWYYKRDLTHVRFFTETSFRWLATSLDAELIIPQKDVVILKKRNR